MSDEISPLHYLADRVLDGRLDELLCRWAAAGAGRRIAAQLLAQELGIPISPPTVQKWTEAALAARSAIEENGEAA